MGIATVVITDNRIFLAPIGWYGLEGHVVRLMNFVRDIAAVSANLCLKIFKSWVQRLDLCKRARGDHAKEIDFIYNGIKRTFTGVNNFIDIQNRFCFI